MKLATFPREIGAAPEWPVLGTDVAPTTPIVGQIPSNYLPILYGDNYPIQSLVAGYWYEGVGVAPDVEAGVYAYDQEEQIWWLIETLDLIDGELQGLTLPVSSESLTRKIVIALVPVAPAGAPDGVYHFVVGGSRNEASNYAKDSTVALLAREATVTLLARETTQQSIDNAVGALESNFSDALDESGNVHGQLALGYVTPVNPVSAVFAIPADGFMVATNDYEVVTEPSSSETTYNARVNGESPAMPADGWTDNLDGTYTHDGSAAFTAPLVWFGPAATSVLCVNSRVLVRKVMTGGSAGTLQAHAGTTAGAASAWDSGTSDEVLTVVGNGGFTLTPSANYDGTAQAFVWVFSQPMDANLFAPQRVTQVIAVCDSAGALQTNPVVRLGWYRLTP